MAEIVAESARTPPLSARSSEGNNLSLLGLSQIKSSPKWSFNGRRTPGRSMDAPGPGAYGSHMMMEKTSRYKQAPQHAFSVSSRDTFAKVKVPGPGAYGHSRGIGSGVAWSLTPRRQGRERGPTSRDHPGPGAHDIRSYIGEGPKFSASPRDRNKQMGSQPGPGDYEQVDMAVSEKHPHWAFGTSQRVDGHLSGVSTPGPGAYMHSSILGEGPKYSMKARLAGPRPQASPGPGAHGGHYTTFG